MPELFYNDKKIYYEIYGEGQPLIILNGIMMSHLSWKVFIPELSKHRKVILFDFLDQGKSDKYEGISYKHDLQVKVLEALIHHLEIEKADIFGISYGAEIALQFAISNQEKVNKLLIFNTASFTSPWLHDIGRAWVAAAKTYDPLTYYYVTIPYIYSPGFYNTNSRWMDERKTLLSSVFTKSYLDGMIRLIESSEGYDIREELHKIEVPTLIVASDYDYITPSHEAEYIHKQIKNSNFVMLKDCGHASMYEKPNEFVTLINGFLKKGEDITII